MYKDDILLLARVVFIYKLLGSTRHRKGNEKKNWRNCVTLRFYNAVCIELTAERCEWRCVLLLPKVLASHTVDVGHPIISRAGSGFNLDSPTLWVDSNLSLPAGLVLNLSVYLQEAPARPSYLWIHLWRPLNERRTSGPLVLRLEQKQQVPLPYRKGVYTVSTRICTHGE